MRQDAMPDMMIPLDTDEARWQAVLARDPAPVLAPFLYAVTTQGVFCRSGCPSRPPLRKNTRFFADVPAAEAA
ncbi:MAG TPA: Ada metal-binding domain-containing protein, partial [Roseomonas sp.]